MPKQALELIDYLRLARRLSAKVEPETIEAVVAVEKGKNDAFYPNGFPTILFERHIFYRHANGALRDEWYREFPAICNPHATPQGGYGSHEVQPSKFNQAFTLDPNTAMMACSWGCFQELGANFGDYGFATVGESVDLMKSGIDGQCEIFVRSIKHRGLVHAMETRDFASFAYHYNGEGYHRFQYDVQIHDHYNTAKARHVDWAKVEADADASATPPSQAPAAQTGSAGPTTLSEGPTLSAAEPDAGAVTDPVAAPALLADDPDPATAPTVQVNQLASPPDAQPGVIAKAGDEYQWLSGTLEKFGVSIDDAKTSVGTYVILGLKGLVATFLLYKGEMIAAVAVVGIIAVVYSLSRHRVWKSRTGVPCSLIEAIRDRIRGGSA